MIKEKIKELADEQKWNHNITLPDGTQTSPGEQISHGKNLVKWGIESILDDLDLKNKVLDLGCNDFSLLKWLIKVQLLVELTLIN